MFKKSIFFRVLVLIILLKASIGDDGFYPRRFGLSPIHTINSMQELYIKVNNRLTSQKKIEKANDLKRKLEHRRRKIFEKYLGSRLASTSLLRDFHTNQFL